MLKENRYQESINSKIFNRISNNHSLSQAQLIQATNSEFRMSINLLCLEGTSEKLWHILKSHKTRSTFYTLKTICVNSFVNQKIK